MNRIRALIVLLVAFVLVGGLTVSSSAGSLWLTSNASWTDPGTSTSSAEPRVVDLSYARHPMFDRVVVRIRGPFPGGGTHYQRDFVYDPSGLAVPVRGRSGLRLALIPAYGHDQSGRNLYVGPRIARPRFPTLKALAYTGDFEGHVTFAFALTHRAPYRIFTLEKPNRIVIDFHHRS